MTLYDLTQCLVAAAAIVGCTPSRPEYMGCDAWCADAKYPDACFKNCRSEVAKHPTSSPRVKQVPQTHRVLTEEGYTSITLKGSPMLGQCSREDSLLNSDTFEATNAHGAKVTGTVCCGWLWRGCTIRRD